MSNIIRMLNTCYCVFNHRKTAVLIEIPKTSDEVQFPLEGQLESESLDISSS